MEHISSFRPLVHKKSFPEHSEPDNISYDYVISEKPYLTERIIDNLFRRIRTQESVAAIAPLIKCDVVYDDGIFERSVGETALYHIYIYANGWGLIKNFPFKEDYDPKVFDEIYQWFIDNQGKYELEPIKPLGTK